MLHPRCVGLPFKLELCVKRLHHVKVGKRQKANTKKLETDPELKPWVALVFISISAKKNIFSPLSCVILLTMIIFVRAHGGFISI